MANPRGNPQNLKPPWPKGTSGNPSGRPRKVITEGLTRLLDSNKVGGLVLPEGRTLLDVILEGIVRNIMAGNAKTISDLWERFEGKVALEVAAAPDNPLVTSIQQFLDAAANGEVDPTEAEGAKAAKPRAKKAKGKVGRVARKPARSQPAD